jgi:hypothetical protein
MQIVRPLPLLVLAAATLLASCAYPPVMQGSYAFDRHPGVFMETWWQYNADGSGYTATYLVNRSNVDKCAWTDAMDSRVLHPGQPWQIAQVQSPGSVGVANVTPTDPDCVNARRDYGAAAH